MLILDFLKICFRKTKQKNIVHLQYWFIIATVRSLIILSLSFCYQGYGYRAWEQTAGWTNRSPAYGQRGTGKQPIWGPEPTVPAWCEETTTRSREPRFDGQERESARWAYWLKYGKVLVMFNVWNTVKFNVRNTVKFR